MNHFLSIFLYLLNPFCHIITFYMHKRNEGKAVKCYLSFSLTEVHSGCMCAYGHSSLLFVCECVSGSLVQLCVIFPSLQGEDLWNVLHLAPLKPEMWSVMVQGHSGVRLRVLLCMCVWVKCSFCIQSAAQQQLAQVRGAAETEAENEENSSYSFSRTSGCESVTSFVVACFVIFDIFSGFTSVSIWKSNYLKKKSEIKKKKERKKLRWMRNKWKKHDLLSSSKICHLFIPPFTEKRNVSDAVAWTSCTYHSCVSWNMISTPAAGQKVEPWWRGQDKSSAKTLIFFMLQIKIPQSVIQLFSFPFWNFGYSHFTLYHSRGNTSISELSSSSSPHRLVSNQIFILFSCVCVRSLRSYFQVTSSCSLMVPNSVMSTNITWGLATKKSALAHVTMPTSSQLKPFASVT